MKGAYVLNKLLEYSKLNGKSFSEKIGLIRPQAIYDIQNGKTQNISVSMANKIISAFPEVNKSWLLTGEGPMLNTEPKISSSDKESINLKNNEEMTNNMLVSMLYDANQRIKRLEAEIEELKQQQGDAIDSPKKRSAI